MDSKPENSSSNNCSKDTEEQELESAKEENERLKKTLEKVENDYRSLQMRFFDIFQHEPPLKPEDKSPTNETQKEDQEEEEEEVSLHLGLQTPTRPNQNGNSTVSSSKSKVNEDLSLGLDMKSPPTIDLSDTGSDKSEDAKDDAIGETWQSSKVSKTTKNGRKDEELPEQNTVKRARVCVRARCDTPTMNDGCQWRKYGQKISKGNPCPRAYYRCTVAPSCPVRKQVQRCSEDMSILITSYEGAHNHALPTAATAMASTTSAAASILLSGSSTSEANSSTSANLNGLNFTLYNNSRTGQFNLPTSCSPAPPTITLDLTAPQSSHFNRRLSTSFLPSSTKYTSRSLNFSTSEANTFPTAWNNLNYSNPPLPSFTFGKPSPQLQQTNYSSSSSSTSQQFLTETLTKVLTSDPSFQSAVAAAISSMVGNNNTHPAISQAISINPMPQNGNAYQPSYINKVPSSSSSSSQARGGGFMILQPQFPYTTLSKSSSASDLRDQMK